MSKGMTLKSFMIRDSLFDILRFNIVLAETMIKAAKAMMLAKRQLAECVCDAVNLEGINLTLPEIQTLLDGITVGG
ncbi:MAG: hypothetical protein U9N19_02165, partial [Thermodesulfobacteriota bacterium]|nr:hypothetical protein [Thermodesulfobacteriota bacterium]